MLKWSLLFLMAALTLGVLAISAWVAGMNYIGFTASASLCAIASCAFSMYDVYNAK